MKMINLIRAAIFLLAVSQPACRAPGIKRSSVQVLDDAGGRKLLIDGRLRAFADTLSWESRLKYVAVMNLPMRFYSNPGSVLLIGLGGGSIARNYGKERWSVESVEPDSALAGIARSSFGLIAENVKIDVTDARQFLSSRSDVYDVILEDLVSTRGAQGLLMTADFFEAVRTHLKTGGLFALALECAGWNDEVVRIAASTLAKQFANVSVLPIAEPPNRFGSVVLIASASPHEELAHDVDRNAGLDPDWRFGPGYQETHAWDNRFVVTPDPRLVQTDARNELGRIFETIDDSARAQPADYLP